MNNQVMAGDNLEMAALCVVARQLYPKIFSRRVRGNMRPVTLNLDKEGKVISFAKAKEEPSLVADKKRIWSHKKETACHRCGHEYDKDFLALTRVFRPEGLEKCIVCEADREAATKVVAKAYLDQARDLIGIQPNRFSQWFTMEGLTSIAAIFEEIDRVETVVERTSGPVKKKVHVSETGKTSVSMSRQDKAGLRRLRNLIFTKVKM